MSRRFVAVDVETTGLNPSADEIIEVGLVWDEPTYREVTFSLPFERMDATPEALEINGWGKRPFPEEWSWARAAGLLEEVLNDVHLVGKNPQFDASFLAVDLSEWVAKVPWHHRLVDVGSLAWGYYNGREVTLEAGTGLGLQDQPPNVDAVADLMEIQRDTFLSEDDGREYHTALDDARWAHKVFRTIVPKA